MGAKAVDNSDVANGGQKREYLLLWHRMKRFANLREVPIAWALAGAASTCTLVAYQFLTNFTPFPKLLRIVFVILCPASVLSVAFIDIEPNIAQFFFLWGVIALLNSALYAWIGARVRRTPART